MKEKLIQDLQNSNYFIKTSFAIVILALLALVFHIMKILLMLLFITFSHKQGNYIEFDDALEVTPFADGENWYLQKDYKILLAVNTPSGKNGYKYHDITVPKGFVTDFASVPCIAGIILAKWDLYGQAAIVHYFLYWD